MGASLADLGLCVILDRGVARGQGLDVILEGFIAGGGRWVQLREKEWGLRQLLPVAERLSHRAREAGVCFIVNDRLDLALAVEADGLHVGQDDLPASSARRLLPGRILGVSSHSLPQALEAQAAGADYVAIGSIFPTSTKAEIHLVGIEAIRPLPPHFHRPLGARGGNTLEKVASAIGAGADAVAGTPGGGGAGDPAAATRALLRRIAEAKGSPPLLP
jgi:thiamine-phosphate pyrophosphorylase